MYTNATKELYQALIWFYSVAAVVCVQRLVDWKAATVNEKKLAPKKYKNKTRKIIKNEKRNKPSTR